jgi:hypothetical protein
MNEQAILRQISTYFDSADVDKQLQRVHQMQDHLNGLRNGETLASEEWSHPSQLIFPEDFTEAMNQLGSDLRPVEKLLKQLDRIEGALDKQKEKLMKKEGKKTAEVESALDAPFKKRPNLPK